MAAKSGIQAMVRGCGIHTFSRADSEPSVNLSCFGCSFFLRDARFQPWNSDDRFSSLSVGAMCFQWIVGLVFPPRLQTRELFGDQLDQDPWIFEELRLDKHPRKDPRRAGRRYVACMQKVFARDVMDIHGPVGHAFCRFSVAHVDGSRIMTRTGMAELCRSIEWEEEFGAELFDVLDETPQRGFMLEDWLRLMEPVVDIMPVEELVPLTPENKALPDSCYTSEAKSIVGVMAEEAEGLNSKTIGNAHVMALCMDPSGKAQKVLEMLDVDPHAVPAEIKELEECESMTPRHSFTSTSTCAPPERSGPTELEVSSEADQIEKPTDEVVVERLESGASHTGHYVPGMEQGPVTDEVQEGLVREPVLRAQQGRPPVLRAQQGARTLRYVGTTVWVHCEGRAARFFNIPAPKGAQSPKLALPTRVARLQLWCSAAAASNSNNSCCEPSVNGNIMMLGRRHGMTQTTTRSANWRSCPKISCLHCTSLSSE
eukprot:s822_g37.t2